jgi:hypothetical protein
MESLSSNMATIKRMFNIKKDISHPVKMPFFWPVNPYDLEVNEKYLYHLREPAWDARIQPSPPKGDYIVQFIKYRPPEDEEEEIKSGNIVKHAFGQDPCAWKESGKIIPPWGKMMGIRENHIFAQCLFLSYRENRQSPWSLRVKGFDWGRYVGSAKYSLYLEIDANNMRSNMIYSLSTDHPMVSTAISAPDSSKKFATFIRLLGPGSGTVGIVEEDLIINLDEPPPEPPILTRQISETLSDQMREETCVAHTMSRVALKIIRNYIPHWFGDLTERSYCNSSYSVPMMKNISYHVSICNRIDTYKTGERYSKSGNNFLVFSYLYKYIINITGCNGYIANALYNQFVAEWFSKDASGVSEKGQVRTANSSVVDKSSLFIIEKEFADRKHLSCVGADINISPRDKKQISKILQAFDAAFFRDPANKIEVREHRLNHGAISVLNPLFDSVSQEYIKYSLDYNYYAIIKYYPKGATLNHVAVVVGYEMVDEHMILIIKNSWGDLTGKRDGIFIADYKRSTIKKNVNEITLTSGYIYIILPTALMQAMDPAVSARLAEKERLLMLVMSKSNIDPHSPESSPPPLSYAPSSPDAIPPSHSTKYAPSSPDTPPPHRKGGSYTKKYHPSNKDSYNTRRNKHKK